MDQAGEPRHVIKIDDRDPSIFYSNNTWSLGGCQNEYLGTTTRTNKVGAFLRLSFTGTKIVIFGTIDSAASGASPMSLFSLDNDHTQELLQKQTDSVQYQQKLYESPDLAQGTHVLVVTILSVPSVKAYFTFDWAECHTKPTLSYHPTCDISTASPTEQFGDLHPVMLNTSHQGVQMVIRLDDRDCTISYSADTWSLEENNSEYLATTTRTTRPGAFMRIPFIGTKIMVFGTIDALDCGKSPTALFSLDGGNGKMSSQNQTKAVQYQQRFYESPDLEPGPHVLVVTVTSVPSTGAPFIFDYAEYYPCDMFPLSLPLTPTTVATGQPSVDSNQVVPNSDNHSKASQPMFKIDNRDLTISYSSNTWSLGGNDNEYLGTTTRTHLAGASMRIPFIGTKIMIFGTIDSTEMGESPVSLFIIDGGRHSQEFHQKQNSKSQWQKKFYESPNLPLGPHVLEVIIISAPSTRAHFTFDYAQYFPFDSTSMSTQDAIMNDQRASGALESEHSLFMKGEHFSAQSSGITDMEQRDINSNKAFEDNKTFLLSDELRQLQISSPESSFSTLHTSASAHSISSTSEDWWQISEASGSGPMIQTTTITADSGSTTQSKADASTTISELLSPQHAMDREVSLGSSTSPVKANSPLLAKPMSRVRGFLFRG